MFILRQTSVKMAVLLHKQATMPFHSIIAVYRLPGLDMKVWDFLKFWLYMDLIQTIFQHTLLSLINEYTRTKKKDSSMLALIRYYINSI